jgi:hypothetical protein
MLCYNLAMPYQETRDLTSYISAYAPLVGVLVAIGVALMQFYLQREQAKQSLFDKRFTVYTAVEAYLHSLLSTPYDGKEEESAAYKKKQYRRFVRDTRQVEFLFGPEVVRFIEESKQLDSVLSTHPEGDDDWADAMLTVVDKTIVDLVEVFRPYLQLHYEESWPARLFARINRWVDDEPALMASRRGHG